MMKLYQVTVTGFDGQKTVYNYITEFTTDDIGSLGMRSKLGALYYIKMYSMYKVVEINNEEDS